MLRGAQLWANRFVPAATLLFALIALCACDSTPPTGVEVTLEYSDALAEVLISGRFDDGVEAFSARTFRLPEPLDKLTTGTIVILVSPDRNGAQLTLELSAKSGAITRVAVAAVVKETIVPVMVSLTCGDGITTGSEGCDDGNDTANDGCTDKCVFEPGYACGDGLIRGGEICDDAGTLDGDGCSATCTFEQGWICTVPMDTASICSSTCGDGIKVGNEACDDMDLEPGDGCSRDCTLEMGWECNGSPSVCEKCGNRKIEGTEQCDDGNKIFGDGCDRECAEEAGWTCEGEPSRCFMCGNGIVEDVEACDDDNNDPGDGCDASCEREVGFDCNTASPTICEPTCGDKMIVGNEACDDGNQLPGDGCNPSCAVELGWTCLPAGPGEASRCFSDAATAFVGLNGPSCPLGPGAGTFEDPYCTIVDGVAANKLTVAVLPGDYRGKVTIMGATNLIAVGSATISHDGADALTIKDTTSVVRGMAITGVNGVGGGVKVDGSNVQMYDCRIGPGDVLGVKTMGAAYLRLERSFIHDHTAGGVKLQGSVGYELYNNVIVRNGVFGIQVAELPGIGLIVNNTIAENAFGIDCDRTATPVVNSIIWMSGAGRGVGMNCILQYSIDGMGQDPLLVGPHYHLGAGSPAIDGGDPMGTRATSGPAPNEDFDSEHRPIGQGVDIGADEAF